MYQKLQMHIRVLKLLLDLHISLNLNRRHVGWALFSIRNVVLFTSSRLAKQEPEPRLGEMSTLKSNPVG